MTTLFFVALSKIAQRMDNILQTLGLNPVITGAGLFEDIMVGLGAISAATRGARQNAANVLSGAKPSGNAPASQGGTMGGVGSSYGGGSGFSNPTANSGNGNEMLGSGQNAELQSGANDPAEENNPIANTSESMTPEGNDMNSGESGSPASDADNDAPESMMEGVQGGHGSGEPVISEDAEDENASSAMMNDDTGSGAELSPDDVSSQEAAMMDEDSSSNGAAMMDEDSSGNGAAMMDEDSSGNGAAMMDEDPSAHATAMTSDDDSVHDAISREAPSAPQSADKLTTDDSNGARSAVSSADGTSSGKAPVTGSEPQPDAVSGAASTRLPHEPVNIGGTRVVSETYTPAQPVVAEKMVRSERRETNATFTSERVVTDTNPFSLASASPAAKPQSTKRVRTRSRGKKKPSGPLTEDPNSQKK